MSEQQMRAAFWAAVLTTAGLICALDQFGLATVWASVTGSSAASWVQAIGSIGAMATAAFAIWWADRLQKDREHVRGLRERRERLHSFHALGQYASAVVRDSLAKLGSPEEADIYYLTLHGLMRYGLVRAALQRADQLYWGAPELTLHALEIIDGFEAADRVLSDLSHLNAHQHEQNLQVARWRLDGAAKQIGEALKTFNVHLRALDLELSGYGILPVSPVD